MVTMINITGFRVEVPKQCYIFSESQMSHRVWSEEPTWVVFLSQLLRESANLCSKYDLQATCLRMQEMELISMSAFLSLQKLKIMGN